MMKLVQLSTPAFLALLVTCAACRGAEDSHEEAPGAAHVGAPAYGYELAPDPASTPAQPADARAEGASTPGGRLAPELIQAGVRARFPVIRACYEAALQQAPDLAGKVELRFQIQPDGTATEVQGTVMSTIADQPMIQCVIDAVEGASFPATEGGAVDVVYPIMFSPGE